MLAPPRDPRNTGSGRRLRGYPPSTMTRVHNFSAGPAALPEPVLRQAAE